MGNGEQILCFALLVCAAFALLIKMSLPQPTSFLTFPLLILPPMLPGGRERAAASC